jgi:hypothetical protein
MGKLIAGAAVAKKKLASFAIDGEITFRSASERAAFAEELGVAVTRLVDKYHDGGASAEAGGARRHRLVVVLHPALKAPPQQETSTDQTVEKDQGND